MNLSPWILAARPKTLFAGVCPVLIGVAIAHRDGVAYLPAAFAALVGAIAIQIGTNFCNDYCDFFQGADTDERKGPTRAVQSGLIPPGAMLWGTIMAFGVAALASSYLAVRAGWALAVLGAICIGLGVFYTASKYSLAYLGLGDPFVFIFFGPVAVAGTYYVQALRLPAHAMIAGIAPGLLATAILVVNNLRDVNEDRRAGKRTFAVRFGPTFVRWEYLFCMIGAAVPPIVLWYRYRFPDLMWLSAFVPVVGFGLAARIWRISGRELNPYLGRTALLLLVYTVLFCLGCVWG